ncbi:MAG: hypothetical protein QM820_31805 [Minicystis sp.]
MHRARKRAVAALALLGAVSAAPAAWAFHAGATFDKPASAGGGEGIYYAGAPADHGWTCTHCHQGAEGKIKLYISQPELFTAQGQQPYAPGGQFKFEVDLVDEHLGLDSPMANRNGLVVQILDDQQRPAGALLHGDDMVDTFNAATIISAGLKAGQTHWSFTWFAPGPTDGPDGGAPGKVTIYFAAVDGNGAKSGGTGSEQDPFDDDVFTVSVPIEQGKAASMTGADDPPPAPPPSAAPPSRGRDLGFAAPMLASVLGLSAVGLARKRRRR